MDRSQPTPRSREQRWPTAPLVDVLLLHGPEPEPQVAGALDDLRSHSPATKVLYLSSDYGQLSDVRALISNVRERVDGLHLLINNAGRAGPSTRTLSADGHEITFQTNYLALVALTTGLLLSRPPAFIPESSPRDCCT